MHRSRLLGYVIDCQTADVDAAAKFWSEALGRPVGDNPGNLDGNYRVLATPADQPDLIVQKVTHESRIHLDLEADDIEAEVARLEKLGAKKVGFVKRWWVMEAPTGQRFCVCQAQREALASKANVNEWK